MNHIKNYGFVFATNIITVSVTNDSNKLNNIPKNWIIERSYKSISNFSLIEGKLSTDKY